LGLFLSCEVSLAVVADCIKPLSGIDRVPLPGDGCRTIVLRGVPEYHPVTGVRLLKGRVHVAGGVS
jgi:hypothetical protein